MRLRNVRTKYNKVRQPPRLEAVLHTDRGVNVVRLDADDAAVHAFRAHKATYEQRRCPRHPDIDLPLRASTTVAEHRAEVRRRRRRARCKILWLETDVMDNGGLGRKCVADAAPVHNYHRFHSDRHNAMGLHRRDGRGFPVTVPPHLNAGPGAPTNIQISATRTMGFPS